MSIQTIVEGQTIWYIFVAPLAGLILLISTIAELGRAPFDLMEAESEIVAGFHIEYTGMKFGLFYAGELLHTFTLSAIISSLFLGGWRGPFVEQVPLLGVFYLFAKAFFMYWVIMWIKYTLPRIRIDHMLAFNWKFLTPLSLVVLVVTAVLDKALQGVAPDQLTGVTPFWYMVVMLAANIIMAWITLAIVRRFATLQRQRVGEPRPVASPDLVEMPVQATAVSKT